MNYFRTLPESATIEETLAWYKHAPIALVRDDTSKIGIDLPNAARSLRRTIARRAAHRLGYRMAAAAVILFALLSVLLGNVRRSPQMATHVAKRGTPLGTSKLHPQSLVHSTVDAPTTRPNDPTLTEAPALDVILDAGARPEPHCPFQLTDVGQATRTWVSGVDDDANPCSRKAPCKTFAGAISKTAGGGEIDVLDPGGFGAVTITKSITIDGGVTRPDDRRDVTAGVIRPTTPGSGSESRESISPSTVGQLTLAWTATASEVVRAIYDPAADRAFVLVDGHDNGNNWSSRVAAWGLMCANCEARTVVDSDSGVSRSRERLLEAVRVLRGSGQTLSQPPISNGAIFVSDWGGFESSLDTTACIGTIVGGPDTKTAPQCLSVPGTRAASNGDAIFIAGGDDAFYALDASTLGVMWRRTLGGNSATGGYYGWCSPSIVAGRLLQGVSSNCDDPFVQGEFVPADAGDTISDAHMFTLGPHSATGARIWTSPAIDLARQEIFVTTGSAASIDDGHTDSILRIALNDLSIEDSWKIFTNVEDADWGSSPTLFTDSVGRQLVGVGEANGYYYAFNRTALSEGPVWTTELAKGGACPLCGDGVLSTAAFDGKRLYVGSGAPPGEVGVMGSVAALDPTTGAILWRHTLTSPVIAPISHANGVLFTTTGNNLVALDSQTGELLWSFRSNAAGSGGVSVAHRGILLHDESGTLYAFGVPDRNRSIRSP